MNTRNEGCMANSTTAGVVVTGKVYVMPFPPITELAGWGDTLIAEVFNEALTYKELNLAIPDGCGTEKKWS